MNVPGVRKDGGGLRVNDRAVYISAAGVLIPVLLAAFGLWGQFTELRSGMQRFEEQWNAQAADRAQYRAATDTRLRSLEEDRRGAAAELTALRRDLGDLKVEQRTLAAEIRELTGAINRALQNGGYQP